MVEGTKIDTFQDSVGGDRNIGWGVDDAVRSVYTSDSGVRLGGLVDELIAKEGSRFVRPFWKR